jgi:hypothetical protein
MKSTTTKYMIESRKITFQRVVIPRDLAGSPLLTPETIIRKARISATSWRRVSNVSSKRRSWRARTDRMRVLYQSLREPRVPTVGKYRP